MKKKVRISALVLIAIIATVACGASGKKTQEQSTPLEQNQPPLAPLTYDPRVSLAPLVEKVSPAVVNIKTSTKARSPRGMGPESLFEFFFGPRGQAPGWQGPGVPENMQRSMGSGFIIDPKGYVVTNNHVVGRADEIEVSLSDARTYSATVVGSDDRTDIALLKLENAKDLPYVSFGKSTELKVGDHVVAIGNPFGLDHTVTSGIVSAKERVIGAGPYDDFIQTDASINPGNSGGPLFNLSGEVVGINTAISRSGQGIGFAIPSDLAKGLVESIKSSGKVVRGWLGIIFQPLDEPLVKALGLKDSKGALVTSVLENSPGQEGGLKERDVIIAVNGRKLNSARDLPVIVAGLSPEKSYPVDIVRDRKNKTLNIKIGSMPDSDQEQVKQLGEKSKEGSIDLGLHVTPLDNQIRRQLQANEVNSGVVITKVALDSPAASVLQRGDIITEVNQKGITSPLDLKTALSNAPEKKDILLRIWRRGGWLYVVIPTSK